MLAGTEGCPGGVVVGGVGAFVIGALVTVADGS
jgi:hypothetical protein